MGIRNTFLLKSYANGGCTKHVCLFLSAVFQICLSQRSATRQPNRRLCTHHLNRCKVFFHLSAAISWSQDKTHDPCGEEMGKVPSDQWRQQRDVEQLHTGSDGAALPPESVCAHRHTLFTFFSLNVALYAFAMTNFLTALKDPVLPSLQMDYPVSWRKPGLFKQKTWTPLSLIHRKSLCDLLKSCKGSSLPHAFIFRSALIPCSTLTQFQKDPKISHPTIQETSHL